MKRHLSYLPLALVLLSPSFLGCDSSDEIDEVSIIGSWTAVQINGQALSNQDRLLSGFLLFKADMTYEKAIDYRGDREDEDSGNYTVSGTTIRFFPVLPIDHRPYSGAINGKTIELSDTGDTIVFEKD